MPSLHTVTTSALAAGPPRSVRTHPPPEQGAERWSSLSGPLHQPRVETLQPVAGDCSAWRGGAALAKCEARCQLQLKARAGPRLEPGGRHSVHQRADNKIQFMKF